MKSFEETGESIKDIFCNEDIWDIRTTIEIVPIGVRRMYVECFSNYVDIRGEFYEIMRYSEQENIKK
jgi:hypothetical protein